MREAYLLEKYKNVFELSVILPYVRTWCKNKEQSTTELFRFFRFIVRVSTRINT